MRPIKLIYSSVYIVLEHHIGSQEAIIHGVYINREEAEGKASKLADSVGYISILKKPVLGRPPRADVIILRKI